MTPERARELFPVFAAFADRKLIERLNLDRQWKVCPNPQWNDDVQYRIAPDQLQPKWRRFRDGELLAAFYDKWVRHKLSGGIYKTGGFKGNMVGFSMWGFATADQLFKDYEFINPQTGEVSPCGVLED